MVKKVWVKQMGITVFPNKGSADLLGSLKILQGAPENIKSAIEAFFMNLVLYYTSIKLYAQYKAHKLSKNEQNSPIIW